MKFKFFNPLANLAGSNVPGWTAFDLSGPGVCVGVRSPKRRGEKPVVERYVCAQDDSQGAQVVEKLLKTKPDPSFGRVLVLGLDEYQLFVLDKPFVRPEELDASLRWSLRSLVEFSVDQAVLSWMPIPFQETAENRTEKVYVAIAQKDLVNAKSEMFSAKLVGLQAVDVRETSRRNLSALIESSSGEPGVCMVVPEPLGVHLTVTHGGELYLDRFIREKMFDPQARNDQEAQDRQFDRVALEIERTFDFLKRKLSHVEVRQVAIAPSQVDIEFDTVMKSKLAYRVESLNLETLFDLSGVPDLANRSTQALCLTALGGSLRYLGAFAEK